MAAPVIVLLPYARREFAARILSCGCLPVLDEPEGPIPTGCGVRLWDVELGRRVLQLPDGRRWPEVLSGNRLPGPCYLRGSGSGGACGSMDIREEAQKDDLLDWPFPPEVPVPPCSGIVLSDVLFALLEPPKPLLERLQRLKASDIRKIQGYRAVASVAANSLKRLLAGENPTSLQSGLWESGDAFEQLWLGGDGLFISRELAKRGSLEAVLASYLGTQATFQHIPAASEPAGPGPIAIVGLGCRLPQAASPEILWKQLLAGFDAITEVPNSRWDPALFWDPTRHHPDKSYSRIGAFITDFTFNPKKFRIPPSTVASMDPVQQLALTAAADALEDAGYSTKSFDRARTAVILGNSMGGEIQNAYTLRVMIPAIQQTLSAGISQWPKEEQDRLLQEFSEKLAKNLPTITEDSMPGELSNVVAGRIANALDLGGPNFTTDAACASSMAAIEAACKGLWDGEFDMAITGGADRSMSISTYVKFCRIGALSPDGSRPFDAGANGFVMGEGVGILVLKRLGDALAAGDKVYALIRGFGASSDGKGKGITAPNPEGQRRALQRAYQNTGVDPKDVELFECHGTSTVVGDKVEVDCLSELVGSRKKPARIGSIKSNIGHLKSAAGAASFLKATLALHHGIFPPSIHYQRPRTDLQLERVPLQVQTLPESWDNPRFAGVSAFGFGGTNFHAVLERYTPGGHTRMLPARPPAPSIPAPAIPAQPALSAPAQPARPAQPVQAVPVPEGIWALSADSPEELMARCRALTHGRSSPYEPDAPLRLAAAAGDETERNQQLEKAIATLQKGKNYDLLRQRGILLEDEPCDGQLAFLFTGQGSQYIDMGLDLAEEYPIVAQTFAEADEVMTPILGRSLSSYIQHNPNMEEEAQFDALRATDISQPATLTVDVAILRLLAAFGIEPDMVAGHSLGEYGAAVAAGMLDFKDALQAVSARGREMAAVKIDDFGKMAGIATSVEVVMEVLAEIPGYVIPANKNCPTQTVIAGESEAVEAACEAFRSRGITVFPLPVSHAFHSRIVAPASEPLKRVLERLDLRPPTKKITSNVTSRYYPTGPGAREAAIDLLARQVAAPVEWVDQVERMYQDGARIFVECGPKRALTGFIASILRRRPHRAIYTNQPKRGGVLSFRDALASLFALGFPVRERPDSWKTIGERRSTSKALTARAEARAARLEASRGLRSVEQEILNTVAQKTGYPVDALDLDFDLEADLGIDSVKLADIIGSVQDRLRLEEDPEFKMSSYRSLRSLISYVAKRTGSTRPGILLESRGSMPELAAPELATGFLEKLAAQDLQGLDGPAFAQAMLPPLQAFLQSAWRAFNSTRIELAPVALQPVKNSPPEASTMPAVQAPSPSPSSPVVCSGASIGLPGGQEVFEENNIQKLLRGENRIRSLTEEESARFLNKKLVRLEKNPETGEGTLTRVEQSNQVIRLAGIKSHFNLSDYGIEPELVRALDITTQLAFAAGLEALKDAQIPLVRKYRITTTGKKVLIGWCLPESLRDETGVVFASAFPGYDQLIRKLKENGDDGEGNFDRRFLFQILSMGHSQFAQAIGARGPNTAINAACASTTQAITIAEDWIRAGRARRVIVVGADDATGESLLEWIGSGFLAAGAAATDARVEEAALPFDRRRHGLLLGMGAVGMVLESAEAASERGIIPVAQLLHSRVSNSAFHGTRLDAEHIASEVRKFAEAACKAAGVSPEVFASRAVFMSHETFTPARGGSAAAEIAALPAAFGKAASQILITNTKGFTGHAMGAGLEDTVVVKMLQYQLAPPIPHFREPDPELGDLRLSTGGPMDAEFGIRLSAGFGSQLALLAWKKLAKGDNRIASAPRYQEWLESFGKGFLKVEQRQLRWLEEEPEPLVGPRPESLASKPLERTTLVPVELDVQALLIEVIAEKTGYSVEEIDPNYELEADLGVDTVKQAEIFGVVREKLALPRDDRFKLSDYRTVSALAGYLQQQPYSQLEPYEPKRIADLPVAKLIEAPIPLAEPPVVPSQAAFTTQELLIQVIAEKTGYTIEEIDPNYELEADLGVDTVKQAEIFGVVREKLALPRDDRFKLSDYRTIAALSGYLSTAAAQSAPPELASTEPLVQSAPEPISEVEPALKAPTPEEPPSSVKTSLPADFRIRRSFRLARPAPTALEAPPPLKILGTGPLAEALQRETVIHPPDTTKTLVVIDTGEELAECFAVAKSLDSQKPRWICLISDEASGALIAARDNGARAGFARALGREWGNTSQVIALDAWLSPSEAAALVMQELTSGEQIPELFIGPGTREAGALETIAFPETENLAMNPVVLLTGGTRGVTAQVAEAIARRGYCTLLLVARTLPGTEPLNETAAREALKKQLTSQGERATPKQLEEALKPLRAAEEARQTVARLKALGAFVEVHRIDLSIERDVQALLQDVLDRYGHLHLVVHGAGIEESRKLSEKDMAAFERVFAAKAEGGLYLAENLPSSTFFLSMGSVAGHFGNTGQVDYAAANAAMAALCQCRPASLHISWTAWADTGMAVRGGMASLLESRGISFLPAVAGAELAINLVAAGQTGELVVAGALGDMGAPGWHPWLSRVEYIGDMAVAQLQLTLENAPYLADHAIDGVSVLPGVVGLELMLATALHACPQGQYLGAEAVEFKAPLKLYREEPAELEIQAEPQADGVVLCRLISTRKTRTDRVLRTEHFSARILLEELPLLPALPAGFLPEEPIPAEAIYTRFFHGPRFRVLEEVEALALQGIQAQARVWDSGLGPVLESSPLALEAAFQATGLHRMILTGIMALPAGIEAMVQLRAVPEGAALTVTAWLREGESALYDIDVDDTDGHLLKIRGFKLSDLGPIPADKAFTPPEGGWASAAVATSTQANKLPEAEKKAFSSRGTARRIADRLAGQAAAVQALAPWKAGFPGRAPSGQPILPGYSISISHQKGVGVAVALFGEDVPVGMDMESIEPRAAAWKSEWFSEAEQQLLENPEAESLAWSAKESVLKALGMGMALSPKEVLVEQLNPLQVRLIGEASSILGCRSLVLRRCRFSGHWTEKQEERMLLRVGVFTRLLSRVR